MAYRRTENVMRRLAARRDAIVAAAGALAAEAGINAVQINGVSQRAGIATGTVYRYFPSKTDLVAALVAEVSARELDAMRRAADAAPGPLSALAAGIATFAARALADRKLTFALIGEPADEESQAARLKLRRALADELASRLGTAIRLGHLPEQDVAIAAPALLGAVVESLVGPLAAGTDDDARRRDAVQAVSLLALRAGLWCKRGCRANHRRRRMPPCWREPRTSRR